VFLELFVSEEYAIRYSGKVFGRRGDARTRFSGFWSNDGAVFKAHHIAEANMQRLADVREGDQHRISDV